MNINLVLVNIKQKDLLRNMVKDYREELFESKNPGEYKYFDSYFNKKSYKPYFIKVDNQIVGFILVNKYSIVEIKANSIAEFYVKKEYRNKGIGKTAAYKVFNMFPGKWEIREREKNIMAYKFWNKVIGEYTNQSFSELILNNEDWNGPIQIFSNL